MSTFYTYTIQTYIKGLRTLTHLLQKGEEHAQENNIPLDEVFNARLVEDMRPFWFQVYSATNTAVKVVARAKLLEPPVQEQSDQAYADLYKRVSETVAELEKLTPEDFVGNEEKKFKVPIGPLELELTAEEYAIKFGLPNFYFHLVTAYDILRARGVPVGKPDYLRIYLD